jgi:NAD(P)-dependent dehydrogenase (short-subunit alcohol dehydrogenase family)
MTATNGTALVTGASSGIGLAIARVLAEEGHALTVAARRPDRLEAAAQELRDAGAQVDAVAADVADEDDVRRLVAAHADRHGRLDVLVNSAGVGVATPIAEAPTKRVDLQLAVNLRAVILLYRECAALLRAAGAEHRSALVVNLASVAGKRGQALLSTYSATKAGLVGFTQAMNQELVADGVRSVALCPAYVDTPMSDFIKGEIPADQMITTADVAEAVRFLLRLSPGCLVPEIVFERPGQRI